MYIARIAQIEAGAVSLAGWILFHEIGAAAQWNVTFLHPEIVFDPRFSLYIFAAIGIAILLMVRGVTAVSATGPQLRLFAAVEGPVTLIVATILIYIARAWRLATDVLPSDSLDAKVPLPPVVAVMTKPTIFWVLASVAALVLVRLFWEALAKYAARDR